MMPTTLFENLLPEVAAVLDVIGDAEVAVTPQSKRKLVLASTTLKDNLNRAKDYANNLQGGDLSLAEQEEITDMLNTLISRKKGILRKFVTDISTRQAVPDVSMEGELDSTASTPAY